MMNDILGALQNTWPIIAFASVAYFALYRPNKKQQKRRETMLASIKRGSRIVTGGGIYGEIVEIEKETIILKVAEKTQIRVARAAIREVLTGKAK